MPGLHEEVVNRVGDMLSPQAECLDLGAGAGAGALSLRLIDAGYVVTAADAVPENFRAAEASAFFRCDFNTQFSKTIARKFDAIFAVEIIEHLENPRHFFRESIKLLRPNGIFVVSTPNIENPFSVALFLRSGSFQWFSDDDYSKQGHLTPISQWQMRHIASENLLDVVEFTSFADLPLNSRQWIKMSILSRLLAHLSTATEQGQIGIWILKKP